MIGALICSSLLKGLVLVITRKTLCMKMSHNRATLRPSVKQSGLAKRDAVGRHDPFTHQLSRINTVEIRFITLRCQGSAGTRNGKISHTFVWLPDKFRGKGIRCPSQEMMRDAYSTSLASSWGVQLPLTSATGCLRLRLPLLVTPGRKDQLSFPLPGGPSSLKCVPERLLLLQAPRTGW